MLKIVIADDHVVLRQGLRSLLDQVEGWEVVGEANDGFEVMPLVESKLPDIVILDLSMPNLGGIETINRLQRLDKKPAVLVLSAREDDHAVGEAMKAGARGYVPKSSTSEELQFAIRAVLKGQTYLSPAVAAALLGRGDGNPSNTSPLAGLTVREREVMKLLSEGHPNREVAKVLHVSPRTIDSHRSNIMRKLGLNSNAELVQLAIKSGLIE